MSHSTNVIQHSILGDGTVGLHPVKGMATARKGAQLSNDSGDNAGTVSYHPSFMGGWIYSPRKNPAMTEFQCSATGALWRDIFYWGTAPVSPEAVVGTDTYYVNINNGGANPGYLGIQNSPDTCHISGYGNTPRRFLVHAFMCFRSTNTSTAGIIWEIGGSGGSAGLIAGTAGPETSTFITTGSNHHTVFKTRIEEIGNGANIASMWTRNDFNAFIVHSCGMYLYAMDGHF